MLQAREGHPVDLAVVEGHLTEREGHLLSRADLVVGDEVSDAWRDVAALVGK